MFATILKQLFFAALLCSTLFSAVVVADSSADATSNSSNSQNSNLSEIIVTAEKREERIQDVPIPVTVLSAASLTEQNQLLVRDFASSVPGLNISPAVNYQTLAIRGITTGYNTNPTVGITIDDVPFGSITSTGSAIPDVDPGSLSRIEVLRGPQGTLYGANAMGGLLKFVTLDPSTDRVSGSVQAGTSVVQNGAQEGYNFRGAVNIPITDTLAMRITGYTRQDPGYIDNVVSRVKGVNEDQAYGGLLSVLWRPSDAVSLKVKALYQDLRGNGAYEVDKEVNGYAGPPVAGLQQAYIANLGGYDRTVQFYSANLSVNLGAAELTSLTGYNVSRYSNEVDETYAFGGPFGVVAPGEGAGVPTFSKTDRLTQEIRLTVPFLDRFQWLIGGFYSRETDEFNQSIVGVDASTGATVANNLFNYYSAGGYTAERAIFTNLTYQITDKFDVQIGGRQSWIGGTGGMSISSGTLVGPTQTVFLGYTSLPNKFTYLFTPRYKISPDLMVYARIATGYQLGGNNSTNGASGTPLYDPNIPAKYTSSTTTNYEVGIKGDALDHLLTFDASIYYIAWNGLQLNLQSPVNSFNYTANASAAKSDGVELSINAKPLTGLSVSGWVNYDQAVLTRSFPDNTNPPLYGATGDRLPYSSRYSGNLSVDQELPITAKVIGFAGATASYVGNRLGTFITTPERQVFPAYTRIDLRTGVTYESWRAELYAINVSDTRGVLGGGSGTYPPYAFIYITPRTVGLNVTNKF